MAHLIRFTHSRLHLSAAPWSLLGRKIISQHLIFFFSLYFWRQFPLQTPVSSPGVNPRSFLLPFFFFLFFFSCSHLLVLICRRPAFIAMTSRCRLAGSSAFLSRARPVMFRHWSGLKKNQCFFFLCRRRKRAPRRFVLINNSPVSSFTHTHTHSRPQLSTPVTPLCCCLFPLDRI